MEQAQGHKDIVAEIKNARQDIYLLMDNLKITNDKFEEHYESGLKFQKTLEPIIKLFKENEIVSVVLEQRTKKVIFYIKSATTIAVFISALWWIIKQFKI